VAICLFEYRRILRVFVLAVLFSVVLLPLPMRVNWINGLLR